MPVDLSVPFALDACEKLRPLMATIGQYPRPAIVMPCKLHETALAGKTI